MKSSLSFFFLLYCFDFAHGQQNLYMPSAQSGLFRYPVIEAGGSIYYSSIKDTLTVAPTLTYYFSAVNKYTSTLRKSVRLYIDTDFTQFSPAISPSISYSYDTNKHRFYIFSVVDVDSSQYINGSLLKAFPVSIYVTVLDTNLNVLQAAKQVWRFTGNDRYASLGPSSAHMLQSNRILLSYTVRDTFINDVISSLAEKFLIIDDSCKLIKNDFWGWEPIGSGPYFQTHFTTGDVYKMPYGNLAIKTEFNDSIGKNALGQIFVFDSGIRLIDTFNFSDRSVLWNSPVDQLGKRVLDFRNYRETYIFLPTGSMVASSIGAYVNLPYSSSKPVYGAYGMAKGSRSNGYRLIQYYFPPHVDTADYEHGAKLNLYPTVYNGFENRLYLFSATASENQTNSCINSQSNLGQIVAVDTNLNEQWIKYIYAKPGYCIRSYCSAVPDHRNGGNHFRR